MCSLVSTVWKNEKFGLTEKIFRQINSLVICLVKPLLSRNFCRKSVRLKFHNFHTVVRHSVEKQEILSDQKNISSNQELLFSYLVKPLISRNIFQKCVREFPQFPHCLRKTKLPTHIVEK